jgi:hypothetical protein
MSNFRVGQKVACVDASSHNTSNSTLREGAVYTVTGFDPKGRLYLDGARHLRNALTGFNAYRFRPVVERKTDISVFTSMLSPVRKEERV